MSLRKIKRNMARKQLEAEGRRRINKTMKGRTIEYGSDFSYDWKTALARRVKHGEALNEQKKARAR